MRIIDAMQNSTPAKAEALYEKAASTLTETRVARVYAEEIDNFGVVDSYRIEWVIHHPKAKHGETQRESSSRIYSSNADMRAWLRNFFAPVELAENLE